MKKMTNDSPETQLDVQKFRDDMYQIAEHYKSARTLPLTALIGEAGMMANGLLHDVDNARRELASGTLRYEERVTRLAHLQSWITTVAAGVGPDRIDGRVTRGFEELCREYATPKKVRRRK